MMQVARKCTIPYNGWLDAVQFCRAHYDKYSLGCGSKQMDGIQPSIVVPLRYCIFPPKQQQQQSGGLTVDCAALLFKRFYFPP